MIDISYASLRTMALPELLGLLEQLEEPATASTKSEALTALMKFAR